MVITYQTPQLFLDNLQTTLEERELENNLILGLCNGIPEKTRPQEGCVFISVVENQQFKAASIKTADKAIVSGITSDTRYMKELAAYYHEQQIDLKGVVGENKEAIEFSKCYGKKTVIDLDLIVHRLKTVNHIQESNGQFEMAKEKDVELLVEWIVAFEAESKLPQKQTKEKIIQVTRSRLEAGNIFIWTINGKAISMAGIVRKTKNVAILGLVYTPEALRGKGYASSLVKKLSEHILSLGFKYCGLFTDKANPTSNHIYEKIGYQPIADFLNLGFV